MIGYQDLFHVGIRVPDLDEAMTEHGDALDVTWAEVRETEQQVWTPDGGLQQVPLRFTYSAEGPQHIELLEGALALTARRAIATAGASAQRMSSTTSSPSMARRWSLDRWTTMAWGWAAVGRATAESSRGAKARAAA